MDDTSPYRQMTFFGGSKAKDIHPQTTTMKARMDSRAAWLLYSRCLGLWSRSSAI